MSTVKQVIAAAQGLTVVFRTLDDLKSRKQTLQDELVTVTAEITQLQAELDTQKAAFKTVASELT